jgi:hypothetical protein
MTYRTVLTAAAILSFLYGLGFVLAPGPLTMLYNVELDAAGLYIARLYGASLLGFGLLDWSARDFVDGWVQRAVLTANLLSAGLGSVFSLMAQLGGVPGANVLGWTTVALYLLLALAFGYVRFPRA